jgi:hypothetical protein
MAFGWFALCFFGGVFFGVFAISLARVASDETPRPEARAESEPGVLPSPAPIRRLG